MGLYTTGEAVYQLLLDLKVGPPPRFTAEDAEKLVEGIEAEIDSVLLGQGYTVPATGERNIALLGQVTRRKVAALVHDTLFQPERAPDWVRTAHIDYSDFLEALGKGERRLIGIETEARPPQSIKVTYLRVLPRVKKD